MKTATIHQVFIAAIICATAIALAAIILGFAGAIDINCKANGCQLKIESGDHNLEPSPTKTMPPDDGNRSHSSPTSQ
ncbi:MAG: hypothetical protein AAGG51_30620 [Cyanobacteria bacterium P01_G01_bin.54]